MPRVEDLVIRVGIEGSCWITWKTGSALKEQEVPGVPRVEDLVIMVGREGSCWITWKTGSALIEQ